eukprot:2069953-Rhodomonas_salina.1
MEGDRRARWNERHTDTQTWKLTVERGATAHQRADCQGGGGEAGGGEEEEGGGGGEEEQRGGGCRQ